MRTISFYRQKANAEVNVMVATAITCALMLLAMVSYKTHFYGLILILIGAGVMAFVTAALFLSSQKFEAFENPRDRKIAAGLWVIAGLICFVLSIIGWLA